MSWACVIHNSAQLGVELFGCNSEIILEAVLQLQVVYFLPDDDIKSSYLSIFSYIVLRIASPRIVASECSSYYYG